MPRRTELRNALPHALLDLGLLPGLLPALDLSLGRHLRQPGLLPAFGRLEVGPGDVRRGLPRPRIAKRAAVSEEGTNELTSSSLSLSLKRSSVTVPFTA